MILCNKMSAIPGKPLQLKLNVYTWQFYFTSIVLVYKGKIILQVRVNLLSQLMRHEMLTCC